MIFTQYLRHCFFISYSHQITHFCKPHFSVSAFFSTWIFTIKYSHISSKNLCSTCNVWLDLEEQNFHLIWVVSTQAAFLASDYKILNSLIHFFLSAGISYCYKQDAFDKYFSTASSEVAILLVVKIHSSLSTYN